MSIFNKTSVNGWQPQQLTIKDVKFATWIAFFAWVFAVYDFILFGTLLPEIGLHFGWDEVEQAEIATWVAVGGAVIALAIGRWSIVWDAGWGLSLPLAVPRCAHY